MASRRFSITVLFATLILSEKCSQRTFLPTGLDLKTDKEYFELDEAENAQAEQPVDVKF